MRLMSCWVVSGGVLWFVWLCLWVVVIVQVFWFWVRVRWWVVL